MDDQPAAGSPLTWAILAGCAAVTFLATGPWPNEATLAQFAYRGADLSTGQAWHLVSSIFVHGNLIHLGFNMMFLAVFGSAFEKAWGSARFALVFIGAGVAGSLIHGMVNPDVMVVGTSGALYGLMGAVLLLNPFAPLPIFFWPAPAVLAASAYLALLPWLTLGPLSFIAHAAHLGGLFAGALVALFLHFRSAIRFLVGVPLVLIAGPALASRLQDVDWGSFTEIMGLLSGPIILLGIGLVAIQHAYKEHMDMGCLQCGNLFLAFASWSKEKTVLCPHCDREQVIPSIHDT